MNESGTHAALLAAARRLFARRGYDGTSLRAITGRARANLGAVTYHFGSKRALYHAVIASFVEPLRRRVDEAAASPGTPLDRIDAVIRAYFDYLGKNPDLPRLMVQELASGRTPAPPALEMARHVLRTLAALFAEGQLDGSIRQGHPGLMAASVLAQPVFLHLASPLLRQAAGVDLGDPSGRAEVVEHVIRFVRAGLEPDALREPS